MKTAFSLPLRAILPCAFAFLNFVAYAQPTHEWTNTVLNPTHLVTDASGNVYSCGGFQGNVDVNPGVSGLQFTSNGGYDFFVRKFDSDGNFIWAFQIGGTGMDFTRSIKLTASGDLLICGGFSSELVDFDPGLGVHNLDGASDGTNFILKVDSAGNFLWAVNFKFHIPDITTDPSDNVYVAGHFTGTRDFDPGVGTTTLASAGSDDIYVLKLNSLGNFVWVKQMGGSQGDKAIDVETDDMGNIYYTGTFSGTADFDPSAGTFNLVSNSSMSSLFDDVFIAKLTSNGGFIWAKRFDGASYDYVHDMVTDGAGNIHLLLELDAPLDVDPGAGVFTITPTGTVDATMVKLDSAGAFTWAKSVTGGLAVPAAIDLDLVGSVYVTGYTDDLSDLDPGAGVYNLSTIGAQGSYIQKLTANGDFQWALGIDDMDGSSVSQSSCIGVDLMGHVFTCGSYNGSVDLDPTIGTNITAPASSGSYLQKLGQCEGYGVDVQSSCSPLVWIDGNTYSSSNYSATHVITAGAASGCDSIVTLNFTLNSASSGTDVQSACGSYTWIDGNNYTSSNNTATHTLTNAAGCDSVVTLDLTINSVVNTVTQAGSTLTADENGATYQWLDCPGLTPINGETGQSFTPSTDGNYAVMVTLNGCVDTSSCLPVAGVGIAENDFGATLQFYPNPTHGDLTIDLGETREAVTVRLLDLSGRMLQSFSFYNVQELNLSIDAPAGSYLLTVESEVGQAVVRVVRE